MTESSLTKPHPKVNRQFTCPHCGKDSPDVPYEHYYIGGSGIITIRICPICEAESWYEFGCEQSIKVSPKEEANQ